MDNMANIVENKTSVINENTQKNINISYNSILIIGIMLITVIYFAYTQYKKNSDEENFINNQQQEKSDYSDDFNLRSAINQLNSLQNNIMSNISENLDI